MPTDQPTRPGDTFEGLALEHGYHCKTLADHGKNHALLDPATGALVEGVVVLPDKIERVEVCAPGERHRFRRLGVLAELRLTLKEDGEPLAGERYVLEVDGKRLFGKAGGDGTIVRYLPAGAREATLYLRDRGRRYRIRIDPRR